MTFIILSWIYIAFIFFSFGMACTVLAGRIVKRGEKAYMPLDIPHVSVVLTAGMICTTVIAAFLSLFIPLSLMANVIVLSLAVLALIISRQTVFAAVSAYKKEIRSTHWTLVVLFAGFVLVAAFLSALPSSHNDDGLYYATTIKWIEEYGSVKGLANVNARIGFNSNWHVLQALFSFHYLNAGNFNDLNGLLLLIIFPYSLTGLSRLLKSDYRIVTIARALFFLPLLAFHFGAASDFIFFNVNFVSAPAADLAVCALLWLTLIWLAELDVTNGPGHDRKLFFITLMAAFLFTVKPSAAPILVVCLYFFIVYLLKKQFMQLTVITVLCVVVTGPWIARNVIISGYPVFPLAVTDILQVDWKFPVQHVKWFENAVRVYAIDPDYDLNKPFTVEFFQWFPRWFGRLSYIQSVIVAFSALSAVLFLVIFLQQVVRKGKAFVLGNRHLIFSVMIAAGGSVFWLLKGPDPRLGYGFTGMLSMLMLSVTLHYFLGPYVKYAGYVLGVIFYFIVVVYYKDTWKRLPESVSTSLPERRLPKAVSDVTLSNGIILHLVEGPDCWYMPLPVANKNEYYTIQPVPRGKFMKDGFKVSQKSKSE